VGKKTLDFFAKTLSEGDMVFISSQNIEETELRIVVKIEFVPGRYQSEIDQSKA
jgi:hypothetical protein